MPLLGCGGPSGSSTGSGSATTPASLQPTPTPTPGARLDAAARALRGVRALHVVGSLRTAALDVHADLHIADPTHVAGHLVVGGAGVDVVVAGAEVDIRGADFVAARAGGIAGRLIGDRWIQVHDTSQLGPLLVLADTGHLADCLVGGTHGTLSTGGTVTVNGVSGTEVRDAGDAPGSAPSTVVVGDAPPNYPLRATQTGPVLGGGPTGACGGDRGGLQSADLVLDGFGDQPVPTAVPGALSVPGV